MYIFLHFYFQFFLHSYNIINISEEEKTNKISLGDGTALTQVELWDWNKKEEKHHEARRRVTEANYNNMSKHKGIGINEVSTSFSFYAPYAPGTENNSQPWGWFRTPQQAMAGQQQYGGAWDNDNMLIGHSAFPFVLRGGYCGHGSSAGVLSSSLYFWRCGQLLRVPFSACRVAL